MAEQQRHHLGLVLGGGAVDAEEPGESALVDALESPPALGGGGGAQRLGEQAGAGLALRPQPRPPGHDRGARQVQPLQQAGQGVLGVALVAADRLPAEIVAAGVETRQHQHALGQAGDHLQKRPGGGNRAGGTGGDHRPRRRFRPPRRRLGRQHPVAPGGGVDGALVCENPRPALGEDGEKAEGELPVAGIVLGHQPGEAVEAQPFGLDLIQQMGEVGGQAHRLGGGGGEIGGTENDPRQQQSPAEVVDGRRQVEAAGQPRQLLQRQPQFLGVEIAQRRHGGEQQGPAAGAPQEGFAQRAAGAPGRQQHRHPSQRDRVGSETIKNADRQLVNEREAGRDRV